jgi:hypothetical protein
MASGSLTRGKEVDNDPNEGGAMQFLGEGTVITIYNGRLSLGMLLTFLMQIRKHTKLSM